MAPNALEELLHHVDWATVDSQDRARTAAVMTALLAAGGVDALTASVSAAEPHFLILG